MSKKGSNPKRGHWARSKDGNTTRKVNEIMNAVVRTCIMHR